MSQSPYKDSIRASKWDLRAIFNEDRFMERADKNEIVMKITRDKPVPEGKIDNWVPGTTSQELKGANYAGPSYHISH